MMKNIITQITRWFRSECPDCGSVLNYDQHGYSHKWAHCPTCGYCTYIQRFTKERSHHV